MRLAAEIENSVTQQKLSYWYNYQSAESNKYSGTRDSGNQKSGI